MKSVSAFISYVHKDQDHPILSRLTSDLIRSVGINIWMDTHEIQLGDSLFKVIEKGIAKSDYFLSIISKNTLNSNWATSEFHLAYTSQFKNQRLKILPILIDKVDLPPLYRSIKVIDLTEDYGREFNQLMDILILPNGSDIAQFDVTKSVSGTTIIDISNQITERLLAHFSKYPRELHNLNSRKFEELVAELFHGFGFLVELTKATRDGGRDVIAIKHSIVDVKYLIECKKPDIGHKVGIKPVRELYGVKTDEGASKAILATTAFFTPDALLFFERHKWEMEPRDFAGVKDWIDKYLVAKQQGKIIV